METVRTLLLGSPKYNDFSPHPPRISKVFDYTLVRGYFRVYEAQRPTERGATQDAHQPVLHHADRRGGPVWRRHHQVLRGRRDDRLALRPHRSERGASGERTKERKFTPPKTLAASPHT